MHRRLQRWLVVIAALALAGTAAACGGGGGNDSEAAGGGGATTAVAESAAGGATTEAGGATTEAGGEVAFTGSLEDGLPACYEEPEPQDLTLAFASPLQASEPILIESKAMQLEAEALGGNLKVVDAQADPDKQITAVEQFIAEGVDGIVVFPIDPAALAPVLKKAEAAGIPVIGIDVTLDETDPGPGYASQVWQRRDFMTYLQAKAAADLLDPGSEIVQAGFALPVPTIELAVSRAAFWAEKFGLQPVGRADNQTDDIPGGEKAMTELLAKYPDAKGLIAYNDNTAVGAAAAVRGQGKDLILVGNNGDAAGYGAVESGTIDATVQMDAPTTGRCAVWGLYDAIQGAEIPKTVLGGEPKLVTSETLDSVPPWDEVLKERYGKTE